MNRKSLLENSIYSFIGNLAKLIVPFFSFSYASHILQSNGIGKVSFSCSIVAFFIMLANLGISSYGIREAARIRDDVQKLSQFVQELLCINIIASLVSFGILFMLILFWEKIYPYRGILLIYGIQVLIAPFNFEWLCGALEKYSYITKRSIFFYLASFALCVILVRDIGDYWLYALINVSAIVGTAVCNTLLVREIFWRKPVHINLHRHMKPIIILFARTLSINIYANLDTFMLGYFTNDTKVGFYSLAVKLNKIFIPLISSVGIVLIPRLSYYIENKQRECWKSAIKKSFHVVIVMALPIISGIEIMSNDIVLVIAGDSFTNASITMRIIAPVIVLIAITTIINDQILIPYRQDTRVLVSTIVGAIVNVFCNFYFIPVLEEKGAAIATVVAESAVLVICVVCSSQYVDWKNIVQGMYKYLIACLVMTVSVRAFVNYTSLYEYLTISLSFVIGVVTYISVLWLLRCELLQDLKAIVRNRGK